MEWFGGGDLPLFRGGKRWLPLRVLVGAGDVGRYARGVEASV